MSDQGHEDEDWLLFEIRRNLEAGDYDEARRLLEDLISLGGVRVEAAREYLDQVKTKIDQAILDQGIHEFDANSGQSARYYFDKLIISESRFAAEAWRYINRILEIQGHPRSVVIPTEAKGSLPTRVGSPDTPARDIIRRVPHMVVTPSDAVRPDQWLNVAVFVDKNAPAPGEETEDLEILGGDEDSFEVIVRLVVSAHLEITDQCVKKLTIERDEERSKRVEFRVRVISEESLAINGLLESEPTITALFTFRDRPAGKVRRRLRLDLTGPSSVESVHGYANQSRADDSVQSSDAGGTTNQTPAVVLPASDEPLQKDVLVIDSKARAADLIVEIVALEGSRATQFVCIVKTPLLPEYKNGVSENWVIRETAPVLVNGLLESFTEKGASNLKRIASLRGAGKLLFRASPRIFQTLFWKLVESNRLPKSIAIVSEEPYIPWEIMIPNRQMSNGALETRSPLGVECAVARWTSTAMAFPRQRLSISKSCVITPKYKKRLRSSQVEGRFVVKKFNGQRIRPANFDNLALRFQEGTTDLIHFACHGGIEKSGRQTLLLESDSSIDPVSLQGLEGLDQNFGEAGPLVFLNACDVGRLAPSLVGVGGFASALIDLGASGVIAPLWSVKDKIAHEVAIYFYNTILGNPGIHFAEVMRRVRQKTYNSPSGEDSYAAYCFYGDPLTSVEIT